LPDFIEDFGVDISSNILRNHFNPFTYGNSTGEGKRTGFRNMNHNGTLSNPVIIERLAIIAGANIKIR